MFDTLIVQPIFNALMLLYSVIPGGDFGIAIIVFTIIVRFLMYPLVKRQLHQTKQMRKIQPELAKIKKAANGNKLLMQQQQLELYKRYGISPFRSILILIIQLPIFIGIYHVINILTLHRDQVQQFTYAPLQNIHAIQTIIQHPEQFNHKLLGVIDLTQTTFSHGLDFALLALALISAVTQYIMSKQTMPSTGKPTKKFREIMREAAEGKESDPTEMSALMMNNMIKFMPIMMFLIMISLPGAVALYYTTSNLVATAQQHYLLNKDTEELEELSEEVIEKEDAAKKSKSNAKTRAKKASEAHITRIKAKD